MGGFVVEAEIGFRLNDGGAPAAGLDDFAEQIAGDGDGIASVEGFGQNQVGRRGEQWVD